MSQLSLQSFLPISADSHFPLENLPFGVFRQSRNTPHVGVALGDMVVDLAILEEARLLDLSPFATKPIFDHASLNPFMALGREAWRGVRRQLQELLSKDNPALRDNATLRALAIFPQAQVEMLLPVEIGNYTDFYSSREHATNVGTMLRGKDNALNPNWLHLPVAYHGRASSVVVSGTDIRRPWGQRLPPGSTDHPKFAREWRDRFRVGGGLFDRDWQTAWGRQFPVGTALEHVFGLVLVNDWSARGRSKVGIRAAGSFFVRSNFSTSISPWVVTLDALVPFQTEGPSQDPLPLPPTCGLRGIPRGTFNSEALGCKGKQCRSRSGFVPLEPAIPVLEYPAASGSPHLRRL